MAIAVSSVCRDASGSSACGQSFRSWLVVISAAWFFFYEFMILNMFNAVNEPLMQEFHISATTLGWLSSCYSAANLLFLFPAGMILDRVSTRRLILLAMGVSVLATLVFAQAPTIVVAALCRFAMGIGGAFCLLSAVRLASRWFPPQRMALVVGIIIAMAFIGGSVAQNPMTVLTGIIGWRQTLMVTAGFGALMWFMVLAFVRDFPPGYDLAHEKQANIKELGLAYTIRMAIANRTTWMGGLYTSLLNLPIFLLGMYGTMYLEQVHQLTRSQASIVTMMLFIGTLIGSPVIGWISDRMGRRRMPMLIFGILSLVVMLLLMLVPHWSMTSLMLIFFALGYFTSAQIITYPLVSESNPHQITGSAMGIASTLIMAGLYSQPFFGWLLELNWDQKMVDGARIYSAANFNLALSIMPIAFVFGILAVAFIRETYCRSVEDRTVASH
jgi:MFS family permease